MRFLNSASQMTRTSFMICAAAILLSMSACVERAYRFGNQIENEAEAQVAAQSALNASFNYAEPPKILATDKMSYSEFAKQHTSTNPSIQAHTTIWMIVYFNDKWQTAYTPPAVAYNDQEVIVTLPADARTTLPPFRGCVSVFINGDDGSPIEVGGPTIIETLPECNN